MEESERTLCRRREGMQDEVAATARATANGEITSSRTREEDPLSQGTRHNRTSADKKL